MNSFINIIQFIANKNNFSLPDNFLIYFDKFFSGKLFLSDANIYKCYIFIQNNVYSNDELEKLTNIYIQAKKIKNILKIFIRKKKNSKNEYV